MRLLDDTKRQAILTGALRVLDRHGLAGLSMDAVAKAAGVATGTIYLYFENKDALLNALYVDVKAELSRQVFSAASPTAALRPAFEQMCVAYLEYVTAHRADLVFMREFPNSPHLLEESRARTSGTLAPLVDRTNGDPLTWYLVENIGVEPMTSCMPCKRSSQLS